MLKLFHDAGWVAWPLGFCSVLALGIVLERLFTLARLRSMEDQAFAELQRTLTEDSDAGLRDPQIAAAPITQILHTLDGLRGATEESRLQVADVALSMQRMRLRRYLSTLATIGSTSPFIGLFGTVLGVLTAFQALKKEGGEVMAQGISEALSATAVGLMVAIPSVIFYNFLLGRVQGLLLHIQGHAAQLIPLLHGPTRPMASLSTMPAPRHEVVAAGSHPAQQPQKREE